MIIGSEMLRFTFFGYWIHFSIFDRIAAFRSVAQMYPSLASTITWLNEYERGWSKTQGVEIRKNDNFRLNTERLSLKSERKSTFSRRLLTSARQTLASFFRSVLALLRALLLLSTGTLIMGVLMLELATMRISLSLGIRCGG